MVLYRNQKTVN